MNDKKTPGASEITGGEYALHSKTDDRKKIARKNLMNLFQNRPLPDEHLLTNMGLYMRSSALAKLFFLDEMYQKILDIPGKIMIFGLWWGQDAIVMENLRAIHEPYNHARRLVGFDTFRGYPDSAIGEADKRSDVIKDGGYAVSENYYDYLCALAQYHEDENAMYNIKKMQFVQGDVMETVPRYFAEHPETIVSLAYFDMALYEPTKLCLEYVLKNCVKGSVIVMDELNDADYPGETKALKELAPLNQLQIKRSAILPDRSYWIV